MQSMNRQVWEHITSQPNGYQFTVPALRRQLGAGNGPVHAAVYALVEKGVITRKNSWDGNIGTVINYEVIDNTKKPGPIAYARPYYPRKQKTARKTEGSDNAIASQIIALAAQLSGSQALRDYSMPELLAEITRRTK